MMMSQENSTDNPETPQWLGAREAASYLDISRATLYAYVSRGYIHPVPGPGRGKRYPIADLQRLKARSHARSGHGPVAGAALSWGEPVLETSIFAVMEGAPTYRGQDAIDLAASGLPFEAVADGLFGVDPGVWPPPTAQPHLEELSPGGRIFEALQAHILRVGRELGAGLGLSPHKELELGRGLISALPALGSLLTPAPAHTPPQADTIAGALGAHLGLAEGHHPALNSALILCAEHGLNASTFAARVVASTGADLTSCLLAGSAALSGPKHGGMSAQVEALYDAGERHPSARDWLNAYFHRGESPPDFGHPLYPQGDPRGQALINLALQVDDTSEINKGIALIEEMKEAGHPNPSLDFGLVTLRRALKAPRGSAQLIFAIGRMAGWIAHIQEQRHQPGLVRPRARYRG